MALTLKEAFDSTFHEKYCFSDFLAADAASLSQRFPIAGEHHDERAYYRPTKTLKTYSRFLNQFVFAHALVAEEVIFSYRKETSVLQALSKHAGNTCFFKSDLTHFFESISELDIVELLKNRLAASPISDLSEYQAHIQRLILIDQRLPIGLPTSPLISNSILYDFDIFFAQWAQEHKITYTRYSALGKSVQGQMVVMGDMSLGGTITQARSLAESLQVAFDAGAKRILLPMSSVTDIPTVPGELFAKFQTSFYSDPVDAVFKALGVE